MCTARRHVRQAASARRAQKSLRKPLPLHPAENLAEDQAAVLLLFD